MALNISNYNYGEQEADVCDRSVTGHAHTTRSTQSFSDTFDSKIVWDQGTRPCDFDENNVGRDRGWGDVGAAKSNTTTCYTHI